MARYRIGELNKRITINQKSDVSDGMGGSSIGWTPLATVWAHVRPKSGTEQNRNDGAQAVSGYLFVIRQRDDVLENMQIVWMGVPFNIRFVARHGYQQQFMEIDAERGVAQ